MCAESVAVCVFIAPAEIIYYGFLVGELSYPAVEYADVVVE